MDRAKAELLTEAVLKNLEGRKGVGDELEQIRRSDPGIYAEIQSDIEDILVDEG